jgi:Zn-dependent protease
MNNLSTIQTIAIYILPLIFAITIHEAAHAYTANKFGDNTAKLSGRLSLNPINHIDPLISIVMGSMIGGGLIFGWAKPVPINFGKLNQPKKDLFWVASAGPLSNLIMALMWALAMKGATYLPSSYFATPLIMMGQAGIGINISLMILNLLPILPLDGGRMVLSVLPQSQAIKYAQTERYGMWVILILLMIGGLNFIIQPLYHLLVSIIYKLLLV